MNIYKPENTNSEKYSELILNIDDIQFTLISVTGFIDPTLLEHQGKIMNLHYHDCYEVFCVEDGELTFMFEKEEASYGKNDLIVIAPYFNHTVTKNAVTNKYRDRILFSFKKNVLKNAYHLHKMLSAALEMPVVSLRINSHVCEIFKLLKDAITSKNRLMASLYFHEIIAAIINKTKNDSDHNEPNIMPDSITGRNQKIQMMINQYYTSDISLEYIAQNLNLSTRQVSRFIKQQYGCTYRELITRMRMKTAMELLITSKHTITEIAMEVGFKSTKGFYKAFKAYYGSLPTKFRKKSEE
ncbi:MAG: helix-turn-helix domain-containing protein [Clostridia bacterium]|nr:helix-turn-helix domain-containing protein [Clostridia bacterium]